MSQTLASSDHLLADLVEELSQKLAGGNSADVEAFLADHADQADKLRPLIPTLQVLVEMGSSPMATGRSRANFPESNGHETNSQPVLGDFRILREVGRGGMGIVYEAEQISLRRRVALKVLPSAAMLDPRALQRFRNEAQAAAALHHSQIVPIFAVGCERGVHYYAMQFIDGLTLAEVITALRKSAGLEPLYQPDLYQPEAQAKDSSGVLDASSSSSPASSKSATETDVLAHLSTEKSRTSPAWFRRIAEQFAQVAAALHHAHEVGVTHRDIKPGNLMLDRLGHIWITDFGLARIEGEGNLTMTGDLVGTLRYMSPEQSLAKRIGIDHRTDIYSLGITLYELFTLHPALPGHGRQELLRQIAFEEPKPPRKLNAGIPRDLETIVLKMIEKNPAERYQTASDLVGDFERFAADRHIEARRPSFLLRAARWTRKHQGFAISAAVTILVAIAGSVGWYYDHHRRVINENGALASAIQETSLRYVEAESKGDDMAAWERASSSAQSAKALAANDRIDEFLAQSANEIFTRISGAHVAAKQRVENARRDASFLQDLREARVQAATDVDGEHFDYDKTNDAYQLTFERNGIDVLALGKLESANRIRVNSLRETLVNALLFWSAEQSKVVNPTPDAWYLLSIAESASTDSPPWHKPVIRAIGSKSLTSVQELARSKLAADLPPDGVMVLAMWLQNLGDTKESLALLLQAVRSDPGNFWLNEHAGLLCQDVSALKSEAIWYHTAAVSLVPESPGARLNLAAALGEDGRHKESLIVLRELLRLKPDYAAAHSSLGAALFHQGMNTESESAFREAIRLQPKRIDTHYKLAVMLGLAGRPVEAEAEFREVVRLQPTNAKARLYLGAMLSKQGKFDAAVLAYKEAIRHNPEHAEAYVNLSATLQENGRLEEAVVSSREAIRLAPANVGARLNLGAALVTLRRFDEAVKAYRECIRLDPKNADAYYGLGISLTADGKKDEAVEVYRTAIKVQPKMAELHCNLAQLLVEKEEFEEALTEIRKGHELGSQNPAWSYPSGQWVAKIEQIGRVNTEFSKILNLSKPPLPPSSLINLAEFALAQKHRPEVAVRWYTQSFEDNPALVNDLWVGHRYNAACAAILTVMKGPKDGDQLGDAERKHYRHQALVWLRDDLAAWGKAAEKIGRQQLPKVIETLTHWQQDPDLVSLRDKNQVQELSTEDQELCHKLWADHSELLKLLRRKVQAGKE